MSDMTNYVYKKPVQTNGKGGSVHEVTSTWMPARAFFFSVVESVGKDGFLVRKIYASIDDPFLQQKNLPKYQALMEVFPERYGLVPKGLGANTTITEHVMGNNISKFSSTSVLFPGGSPRFQGKAIYIDIHKALQSGTTIVQTSDIIKELEKYKSQYPKLTKRVDKIAGYVKDIDKEALLVGKVPAKAIFNEKSLAVTQKMVQAGRVVKVFGIAFTAYDLGKASKTSVELGSVKPISAEVVRQAGGWGSALAGAKVGVVAGAALGIETGPGAIITGLVGGIVAGAAGYYGADWIADHIYEN